MHAVVKVVYILSGINYGRLVGWSLTSVFSTNMATSDKKLTMMNLKIKQISIKLFYVQICKKRVSL